MEPLLPMMHGRLRNTSVPMPPQPCGEHNRGNSQPSPTSCKADYPPVMGGGSEWWQDALSPLHTSARLSSHSHDGRVGGRLTNTQTHNGVHFINLTKHLLFDRAGLCVRGETKNQDRLGLTSLPKAAKTWTTENLRKQEALSALSNTIQ